MFVPWLLAVLLGKINNTIPWSLPGIVYAFPECRLYIHHHSLLTGTLMESYRKVPFWTVRSRSTKTLLLKSDLSGGVLTIPILPELQEVLRHYSLN